MRRNIYRRVERLEQERTAPAEPIVITVTYVDPETGEVTEGYTITCDHPVPGRIRGARRRARIATDIS